ncbi:hypothetical protein GCM10022221_04580 [Actinocorallia aurea]
MRDRVPSGRNPPKPRPANAEETDKSDLSLTRDLLFEVRHGYVTIAGRVTPVFLERRPTRHPPT